MANVLITEDAEDLQFLYRAAFEKAGYRVTSAITGGDALDKVSHQHFDVIILDLLMLGMGGLDVLRQYDFKTNSPETKLVVVSNLDSPNMIEKAKDFGVDQYLTKANYTPKQVVEIVTMLLAQPSGAEEGAE